MLNVIMNTKLKELFEKSNLSNSDKYEINQIFNLLPAKKKQNIINNFETLVFNISLMHKQVEIERKILIGEVFSDIRNLYKK